MYIWMKLHAPWIEFKLNSNLIESCSDSIAINGCKLMEKVLKICSTHNFERTPFHAFLLGNGQKQFWVGIS
jgi:hypothetical protein